MATRRAFTLIEMIVVVAITAVLLTIIILPIFQTFNMTRAAQAFSEAQDRARVLSERIAQEIKNGIAVRDNSGDKGSLAFVVPARPGSNPPPWNRDLVEVVLPYMKLDILKPAEGEPGTGPSGALVDPNTGKEDPTLRAPKGQVVLPASSGSTIVRYFVGLRDPFQDYNETYTGLLMARGRGQDNLYVLYRAEVQPWIWDPQQNSYTPNTLLFQTDPQTGGPLLDDPRFFLAPRDANGNIITDPNDPQNRRIRQWQKRSTMMTEVSRYDMIQPIIDRQTQQAVYDNDAPRLVPLVQFRPARVTNEPAKGMVAVRQGEEADSAETIGPDVFRTGFGGWTTTIVRVYPTGFLRSNSNLNDYLVARKARRAGQPGAAPGMSIYYYDPEADPNPQRDDSLVGDLFGGNPVGTELFDVNTYERFARLDQTQVANNYPFVRAVNAANGRSGFLSNLRMRQQFVAFYSDAVQGKIVASFNISEVGQPGTPPPAGNPNNLPSMPTGPEYSPQNDPNILNGTWSDRTTINERFNKIWNDFPALRPDIHRFIDLRVALGGDGTRSPLHPDPNTGLPRARIVPGSEEVYGPDQTPGDNYGRLIRYIRTTRNAVGPNQYRMNYVDQPEPPDYALAFPGFSNPPANYTPTSFESAVLQPRFRGGYLQLNSDPNVPLPQGTVFVSYRFQFTGGPASATRAAVAAGGSKSDAVNVDYDSREVINILLTIRNYPQSSLPNPQSVTLKATATVRNFLR